MEADRMFQSKRWLLSSIYIFSVPFLSAIVSLDTFLLFISIFCLLFNILMINLFTETVQVAQFH